MMNKKYILENGILELYLLGELSVDEQIQVENILVSDIELKTKFDLLEKSFEALAFENEIIPPRKVKEDLLQKVRNSKFNNVIIQPKPFKQYLAIAASIAVFMALATIWMYIKLDTIENELQLVQSEKTALEKDLNGLQGQIAETSKWYNAINNPDVEQYLLKGNALAPEAKVISYVNNKDKTVVINAESLPELDENHDYQMWADVKGEMINMGVILKDKSMLQMTYIENAESLNITIEPAGGNVHPTVSQLVTNVYLNTP
jgi:anti-sigma-K factor RskA